MKKLLKLFFPNYSKNFMNDDIGEFEEVWNKN